MISNPEKAALRKHLLEKRDSTSFDLMEIHSEKILSKLMKTKVISEAESIACYYSIGSEVQTVELITQLLDEKRVFHCLEYQVTPCHLEQLMIYQN